MLETSYFQLFSGHHKLSAKSPMQCQPVLAKLALNMEVLDVYEAVL